MLRPTVQPTEATFRLLVRGQRGHLSVRASVSYQADYGDKSYQLQDVVLSPDLLPRTRRHLGDGVMLAADTVGEQRIVDFVSWWRGRWERDRFIIDPKFELDFLVEGIPRARGAGVRIEIDPTIGDTVSSEKLRVALEVVARGGGLLVRSETMAGQSPVGMFAMEEARRLKRSWVAHEGLAIRAGDDADLTLLAESAGRQTFVPWTDKSRLLKSMGLIRDSRIKEDARGLLKKVLNSEDERKPASALRATMRSYQVDGMVWLTRAIASGSGGVLADGMGLGKTLQCISAIAKIKESDPRYRAVVFAPTSLMTNWRKELEKFMPGLQVLVWEGNNRKKFEHLLPVVDIVVCSYDVYKRDRDIINRHPFNLALFDEAHVLKNPDTSNHKAASGCLAPVRIAITGTPVENKLQDLHSLYSIACPALLPPIKEFNQRIVQPFRAGNPEAVEIMREQIRPFILRRTMDQVLPDMPPKIVQDQLCPMTDVQSDFYQEAVKEAREEKKRVIENGGKDRQAVFFKLLMRLRQIATDPRLADPMGGFRPDDSGKLLALRGMMDTFDTDPATKVLIFSQWVQELQLIKEELDQRGQAYSYLTGETKNRDQQVENFQTNEKIRYFLLGLKAGGVGLNITAADVVIIMDPWWNPAIENQAFARAHRLGQTRPVRCYRMISEDTIEQAISEMKEIKQAIADGVVDDKEIPNQTEIASSLIG